MNFQYTRVLPPLRVLVVNPLIPASRLAISKMLGGIVFGIEQVLDLILLVYTNEMPEAEDYVYELTCCAFPCFNTIRATSDLPNITDADVFCFMTNFENPNILNFNNLDTEEHFDTLYLIIKIAISLGKEMPVEVPEKNVKKKIVHPAKGNLKPIIVGDGLVVIDILKSIAKTLPTEIFFCSTPLRAIAKIILSDYLKVQCSQINNVYVWAANDQVFHAEIKKPYLIHDKLTEVASCDWDAISPELLESLNLDHCEFNASWMKREFIEKMLLTASNNPYGCIFKAEEMSKTLRKIWMSRNNPHEGIISLGCISDGSLGTIKGLPYVLPLQISESSWTVSTNYDETSHLRKEIKRINQAAKEHHQKLVPYCKKFQEDNVIKLAFIPQSSQSGESNSTYSTLE